MKTLTFALVLMTAGSAAAQIPSIPTHLLEAAATFGHATHLEEFVESGSRPDDDALDEFLDIAGFESLPGVDGWHGFPVTYGEKRGGVKVKLTQGGTQIVVRLDQTWTPRASSRKTGLDPWLNPPAPRGVFGAPTGLAGLTMPTEGLTDIMLHRAIRTLMNNAEAGR